MKDSPEILSDLLRHLKISGNKLASEIGLNANTAIYHIKNGRNNISADLAKKIENRFPELSYNWLLTGEGEMLKGEKREGTKVEDPEANYSSMTAMHQDIKSLAEGMTYNFEVISNGVFETLKGQQKILKFIEGLDAKEISKATSKLDELLKQQK